MQDGVMSKALPKPLRKQREVLYMPATGHSAVLGTAGSGKTTLALYRAAYLSAAGMPHYGPTLLLTFNQALVTYLNHLKPPELRNVVIETYHKFARGYLNYKGKMGYNSICGPDLRRSLISRALANVTQRYEKSKFFDRPLAFFLDEIEWILSHGIETEEEYKAVERVGRVGTNLARKLRMEVDGSLLDAVRGAAEAPPADYVHQQGWVLIAFRNALWQLRHAQNLQEAVVGTVMRGGDTDTNAAICGALLGAVHGKGAVPAQWVESLLNCRPESGQPHVRRPRPECFWPIDALELAERLLVRDQRDIQTNQEILS